MALILVALFVRDRRVWHVRSDPTPNPGRQRHLLVVPTKSCRLRFLGGCIEVSSLGERVTGDDIQWVHISLLRHKRNMRSSLLKAPGAMWAWSRIKPWVRAHVSCSETPTVDNAAYDGAS